MRQLPGFAVDRRRHPGASAMSGRRCRARRRLEVGSGLRRSDGDLSRGDAVEWRRLRGSSTRTTTSGRKAQAGAVSHPCRRWLASLIRSTTSRGPSTHSTRPSRITTLDALSRCTEIRGFSRSSLAQRTSPPPKTASRRRRRRRPDERAESRPGPPGPPSNGKRLRAAPPRAATSEAHSSSEGRRTPARVDEMQAVRTGQRPSLQWTRRTGATPAARMTRRPNPLPA